MRCVNCRINVTRCKHFSVLELLPEIQSVLATWKSTQKLGENSIICKECYHLLKNLDFNENSQPCRVFGHSKVCIGCGRSIQRCRVKNLKDSKPELNIILGWDEDNEILEGLEECCHPCYLKVSNWLLKCSSSSLQDKQAKISHDQSQQQGQTNIELDQSDSVKQKPADDFVKIVLPHYKRIASTTKHCIFQKCLNQRLQLVPEYVKLEILKLYNVYVPMISRICKPHLRHNVWHLLRKNNNLTNQFSSKQIDNLLELALQDTAYLNFECVSSMSNEMCQYWTGLNVKEFLTLYSSKLELKSMKRGKTKLALYLTKLKTEKCNESLSLLYKMPVSNIELFTKKVGKLFA